MWYFSRQQFSFITVYKIITGHIWDSMKHSMFTNNVLWHKTMAFLYFVLQRRLWMRLNWNYLDMWLIPGSEKKNSILHWLSQRTGLTVKLSGILKKEHRSQSEEGSSAAYYDLNNRDNKHNWLPESSRITLTSSIKMILMEEKAKTNQMRAITTIMEYQSNSSF